MGCSRVKIKVSVLTVVNVRYSPFEEDQCGERVYAVFLRLFHIANFYESYIVLVAIVVYVFQLAQHLLTLLLILVICTSLRAIFN